MNLIVKNAFWDSENN